MTTQKFIFEKRAYNEAATAEEIQGIKDNVFQYTPQIIYLDEIPVVSPFSIQLVFEQIETLGKQMGEHGLIVDIRNTVRPDAITRRAINQEFTRLCENFEHVSFCTGKNFLINTAARFVMYQTNLASFSVNKTVEEAVAAIQKSLKNG